MLFSKLVGIDAYSRMASEGGTYHLVCIQLVSRMSILRLLRVGKVGVKVSLKWSSSATYAKGPSQFGFMGLGARQVKTETQMNLQVSLSVLCYSTKTTLPSHMPT